MDPEHLKEKEWRDIAAFETFQENLCFAGMDEQLFRLAGGGDSFRAVCQSMETEILGFNSLRNTAVMNLE